MQASYDIFKNESDYGSPFFKEKNRSWFVILNFTPL